MEVGTIISIKGLKGIVRYVGEYHVKPGIYVGVELEKPKGRNNGTINGKKYFECPENHGLFVDLNTAKSIMQIVNENGKESEQPKQSPRIDLNSTDKNRQISKSAETVKTTNQSSTNSILKNPQQQTISKIQVNQNQNDRPTEVQSARDSAVTFSKPRSKTIQASNSISLLAQESVAVKPSASPTSATKTASQPQAGVSPAKPSAQPAAKTSSQPTAVVAAKPTAQKPTPPRQASMAPSKSNPSLSTEIQSARPPANPSPQTQKKIPQSARDPPIKQVSSALQTSSNPSQQKQAQHQPSQPQVVQNTPKNEKPSIPPLTIPQVEIDQPIKIESQSSTASVSLEEIKNRIPESSVSAIVSVNRERQSQFHHAQSSAEQSSTENSPRQSKPQQSIITPEIQTKIKELHSKLEAYERQRGTIKQKLIDIATSYKKRKTEQEKYLANFTQEAQKKKIELQISLETDINDLENQILECLERTHRYLEIADEQRANKVMELLRMINEEHVNFENDLDLYINAQRINVSQASQSVNILTERLKKVLQNRQINEKIINKKKGILDDKEKELADKRPRWQEVTQLRTTFSELSEKVNHNAKVSAYKYAEREGMKRFYQMFPDVPFLDSLYLILCIEKKTTNYEIRHLCEITKFVLSGFITSSAKGSELFNALMEIDQSIEKDEPPESLLDVELALEYISSVPLDTALTSFKLRSGAENIKDDKLKNQVLEIADEIKNSPLIHPALLDNNIKEDFKEFAKNLLYEVQKAEDGDDEEDINFDQYKGQLEKFNVPEIDVIKGFMDFQMPQQVAQDKEKVLPEIIKKKQERKDLESKSKSLEDEISKEKAKFEAIRTELTEPMSVYMELADQLEAIKKKLAKYQI